MNIFQTMLDLLIPLFGGSSITAEALLCVNFLSMCATIFVVALPFLVIWRVICLIGGK